MPKSKNAAILLFTLAAALDDIAPPHLAESWDNVGLLSGSPAALVQKILLTIDLTAAVRDEALRFGADLLISYHPPIFKPLKNLCIVNQEAPSLALELHSHGIWIYSPHTALDTAPGGTNDVLAEKVGATVTGSFSHHAGRGEYLKLVAFVPEGAVENVADAVFNAGAGHIGQKAKYQKCSFRSVGHGTFQGDESSNPAVGTAGQYERVPEIRFETILPAAIAPQVIAALRAAHPYEEPAFDLLKMEMPPEAVGLGRYAALAKPLPLAAFARRCKKALGVSHATLVGNPARPISTLAIVAGSCGRIPLETATESYDCVLTGEIKHHDMLAYAAAGISVVALGHGHTERPVLAALQNQLAGLFPALKLRCSTADRDPFTIV